MPVIGSTLTYSGKVYQYLQVIIKFKVNLDTNNMDIQNRDFYWLSVIEAK